MAQCAHLVNYSVLPDCEVVALAELRPELGRRVAEHYGVPRVYASHTEMIANEQLDCIVASQQFQIHGRLVPELARAGVPILTEKPIAGSPEGARRIIAALDEHRTCMMVGYHKRSDPAVMYAKAVVEDLKTSGELGRLQYVRIVMPGGDWVAGGFSHMIRTDEPMPELVYEEWPEGMDQPTTAAYHSFTNFYIHQVNLMRHLMGEAYSLDYVDPSDKVLVMHSASGVTGTLEMAPYCTTRDWNEEAFVCFERGYVKISLPAPLAVNRCGQVEILRTPEGDGYPITTRPTMPWVHAMRQQAINFLRAVRGETASLCGAPEAHEDLLVAREYIRLKLGR